MEIDYKSGIRVKEGEKEIKLDPTRQTDIGVVTHAHLDHLVKDAHMTPPTLDILEVRKGEKRGQDIIYGTPKDIGGFEVTLYPAGHVFGSAMVKVRDVLYTGDFNPQGGRTCKRAASVDCKTLIIETTYGEERYSLPPKEDVTEDLMVWSRDQMEEGPLVLGGYPFGKAQEIIALLNELGEVPYTTEGIAEITKVYNDYDMELKYEVWDDGLEGNYTTVVPPSQLKKPAGEIIKKTKNENGSAAYLSGWCEFYSFFNSMEIDAQFPFSDHAGFSELLDFVEKCDPEEVLTVHGSSSEFAEAVEDELGIEASPLH